MKTKFKSPYYDAIKRYLFDNGVDQFDPRHIEAYMRLEHSTLDGLSKSAFEKEIRISISCITADGIKNAESCAKSFGL